MSYSMILDAVGSGQSENSLYKRFVYERFVMEAIEKDRNISMWEDVCGQAILGTKNFIKKTYQEHLSNRRQDKKEQSGLQGMQRMPDSIEEIARQVAKEYKIPEAGLYVKGSRQTEARSMLIELARRYMSRKMSLAAIGKVLGGITVSAISQNKNRLMEKLKKDERLQRRIQTLIQEVEGGSS